MRDQAVKVEEVLQTFSQICVPRPPPFLPSVCVHNNAQEWKTGVLIFIDLPIQCIIVNANKRSKRGRPGTEATINPYYCVVIEGWGGTAGHTRAVV